MSKGCTTAIIRITVLLACIHCAFARPAPDAGPEKRETPDRKPEIYLSFDSEPFKYVPAGQPNYMLIQNPDEHHLKVGFKSAKENPWVFSKPFDSARTLGKIEKNSYPAQVSLHGDHVGGLGWKVGNHPHDRRYLIDYIYYRYGLPQ